MAAAARVVPPGEIGELVARSGRDDQLARVRVPQRTPGTPERIGLVEYRAIAARLPALCVRREPKLLSLSSRDRFACFEEKRHVDRLVAVEALRECTRVGSVVVEAVRHRGTIRRSRPNDAGEIAKRF